MSRSSCGSVVLRAVLGCLALGAGTVHAAAQATSDLRGVVADETTGTALKSALVTLVGTKTSVRTKADGTFTLAGVPVGRALVRIEAAGYPAVVEEAVVASGSGSVLPVFLETQAVALEGIVVFGKRDRTVPKAARTAADLLAEKYPALQPFVQSTRPNWPSRIVLRGRNTFGAGEPLVVVDGVWLRGEVGFALDALKHIPAGEVKKIDILAGPTAAFLYGGADGAIIVQTQSGGSR